MKAPDLLKLDTKELTALHCLFEGLTVEESVRVLGVQRSAAQYIRGKALKKLGTINIAMAVRMLCAAGWNETEEHGDEEDRRQGGEACGTNHEDVAGGEEGRRH